MDNEKIGKIIKERRKEKNITQEKLGEMVGVSYKAVSKWENGRCMPDISILKKVCNILEISVDNLLEAKNAKNNSNEKKHNKYRIILLFVTVTIFICLTVAITILKNNNNSKNSDIKYECVMTKTYYVENINDSNDGNYLYVTFKEYQSEGVYTIKLSKTISKDLEIGKNYAFTFNLNKDNISATIDEIFNNSELINIVETDKKGLEQKNNYNCK